MPGGHRSIAPDSSSIRKAFLIQYFARRLNRLSPTYPPLAIVPVAAASSLTLIFLGGCGNAGSNPPPSQPANTNVVVLLTSTANNKLVRFSTAISSLTLTDQTGKQVGLYTNPHALDPGVSNGPAEFMHLNGTSEPLVTVSVPQGTYTSATVKFGGCSFSTVSISSSGGLVQSTNDGAPE
jgi:hypothetical protein